MCEKVNDAPKGPNSHNIYADKWRDGMQKAFKIAERRATKVAEKGRKEYHDLRRPVQQFCFQETENC